MMPESSSLYLIWHPKKLSRQESPNSVGEWVIRYDNVVVVVVDDDDDDDDGDGDD